MSERYPVLDSHEFERVLNRIISKCDRRKNAYKQLIGSVKNANKKLDDLTSRAESAEKERDELKDENERMNDENFEMRNCQNCNCYDFLGC